jgi:hypothetical protein
MRYLITVVEDVTITIRYVPGKLIRNPRNNLHLQVILKQIDLLSRLQKGQKDHSWL